MQSLGLKERGTVTQRGAFSRNDHNALCYQIAGVNSSCFVSSLYIVRPRTSLHLDTDLGRSLIGLG